MAAGGALHRGSESGFPRSGGAYRAALRRESAGHGSSVVSVAGGHTALPKSTTHAVSGAARIVITGVGVVTPLGDTLPALWQALCTGQSAARDWPDLAAE